MKQAHRSSIRMFAAIALFFGVAALASAQYHHRNGDWVRLGEARVDGRADHDVIDVNSHNPLRALRLQVRGSAVEFDHVLIHFRHGQTETFPAAFVVQDGASSPYIDLPGDARAVDSVELWYKRANWHGKPRVTLYGRR